MQSEVLEVIIKGLVEDDINRLRKAIRGTHDHPYGNDEELNWLRQILEEGHVGYDEMDASDLIDEFQARGLELVARERRNVIND
jgi:hypothetical protein